MTASMTTRGYCEATNWALLVRIDVPMENGARIPPQHQRTTSQPTRKPIIRQRMIRSRVLGRRRLTPQTLPQLHLSMAARLSRRRHRQQSQLVTMKTRIRCFHSHHRHLHQSMEITAAWSPTLKIQPLRHQSQMERTKVAKVKNMAWKSLAMTKMPQLTVAMVAMVIMATTRTRRGQNPTIRPRHLTRRLATMAQIMEVTDQPPSQRPTQLRV